MISVKEIQKIEKKRKDILKDTYTAIYQQFCKKIKSVVELGGRNVYLTVPAFVIGHPTFDRTKATNYLIRQLRNAGFQVTMTNYFILYVTWKSKNETKPQSEEEPDALPSLINLKKLAAKHSRNSTR